MGIVETIVYASREKKMADVEERFVGGDWRDDCIIK